MRINSLKVEVDIKKKKIKSILGHLLSYQQVFFAS